MYNEDLFDDQLQHAILKVVQMLSENKYWEVYYCSVNFLNKWYKNKHVLL